MLKPDRAAAMNEANRAWYSTRHAVSGFAADDLLEPALALLFIRHRDDIAGRAVLDIGVGAGRTTRYLSTLTPHYVGIDYSPTMIDVCTRRFPAARIELADARDLARFAEASFNFVLFSAAGISTQDHESRLDVLREVARVLCPGGLFVFSAHNRQYRRASAGPDFQFARNPVTQFANVVRWLRSSWRHSRMRRLEREFPEYALVNDAADGYRLLHYYIGPEEQRAQLERVGLIVESVWTHEAGDVAPGATAPESPWLWYVARRVR
jgi:SAM-dependent methyltransferase